MQPEVGSEMGFFDDVPVVSGVEDAAGTAATGAVDTFVADPGNALLGVDAENMGVFEEGKAGAKAVNIGTFGLAGDGGLLTDTLVSEGAKSEDDEKDNQPTPEERKQKRMLLLGGGLLLLLVVVSS